MSKKRKLKPDEGQTTASEPKKRKLEPDGGQIVALEDGATSGPADDQLKTPASKLAQKDGATSGPDTENSQTESEADWSSQFDPKIYHMDEGTKKMIKDRGLEG